MVNGNLVLVCEFRMEWMFIYLYIYIDISIYIDIYIYTVYISIYIQLDIYIHLYRYLCIYRYMNRRRHSICFYIYIQYIKTENMESIVNIKI